MKTTLTTKEQAQAGQKWYIIDAKDQILGRLSVQIANILRGRHKPTFTPHVDDGDYVIVINADKIKVTGDKENDKQYMFYTGYFGNEKYRSLADFRQKKPAFIIEHAVKGMLPRNRLSRTMMKKLKIFKGAEHDHQAQNPVPYQV